jgi:hypothetical protein
MRYRHTQPNFNFLWANVRSARAERSVRGWYVPLGPPPRGFWHENVIITSPAFRAFISGGREPLPHAVSAAAAVDARVGDVGSALGRHFKRWEIERLLECAYSGWR